MSELRIGTSDLPPRTSFERYFGALRAIELSALVGAPIKAPTLAKWKATLPPQSVALHAPWVITHRKAPCTTTRQTDAQSGDFRDSPLTREALSELATTANALNAWAVIFSAPPLFSPSQTNRDRLRAFFAELAPAEHYVGMQRVWIPDALWEPVAAVRFAAELGVLCAVDPLIKDHEYRPGVFSELDTAYAYFRVLGLGRNNTLRQDALDELAEAAAAYDSAAVMFATPERWKDAKNFARNLVELAGADEPAPPSTGYGTFGGSAAFAAPGGRAAMLANDFDGDADADDADDDADEADGSEFEDDDSADDNNA